MEHTELRRKLSDYLDNVLSVTEHREIEEHLNGCPRCREALAELKQVVDAVHDLPPVEPPPWLTTRIMARVREEAVPRPGILRRLFFPLQIKIPLEAAVLICLCITGYYLATMTAPELVQESSLPRQPETQRRPENNALPSEESHPKVNSIPLPSMAPSATPPARSSEVTAPTVPAGKELPRAPRQPALQPPVTPDATAPSDTIKAEKALPTPSRLMQGAPPEARKERHSATAESVPAARDSASPALAAVHLTIRVDDLMRAEREIEEAVSRVGGTIVRSESTPTGRSVAVRVATDHLPDLWARLERLGRVTEHPVHPTGAPGEVMVTIRVDVSR